ncbi:MAG: hypothetical protein RDV48_00675 [Candidatus Eremiobacteraeota bacterium]|nr:hypothetical protein [Candidatus Eremiobacteraeota bacterium]
MSDDNTITEIEETSSRSQSAPVQPPPSTPPPAQAAASSAPSAEKEASDPVKKQSESQTSLSREAEKPQVPGEQPSSSVSSFRDAWSVAVNGKKEFGEPSKSEPKEPPKYTGETSSAKDPKEPPKFTGEPSSAKDPKEPPKYTGETSKSPLQSAGEYVEKGMDLAGMGGLGKAVKDTVLTEGNVKSIGEDVQKVMDGQAKKAEETGAAADGAGKPKETPLERAVNLAKLGLHVPELRKIGDEIKEKGFTKESVEKLKEIAPDLKGVITPENMQAFKDLKPETLDKVFTPEVMKEMQEKFPKLAEKLNSGNLDKFKQNLGNLQQNLTKEKMASTMSQLEPWVRTAGGEGTLNMLDRMIGDPSKLGGGDKTLSTEDFKEIARGALNTGTGQQLRDQMLLQNVPLITHGILGRELKNPNRVERRLNFARNQATPERIASEAKARQNVLGSVGLPDSTVPRSFTEQEIKGLADAARRAQNMGMGSMQCPQGSSDQDAMHQMLQNAVKPLMKTLSPENGITQQEMHNLAQVGNMTYDVLGSLYQALGGRYR